MSKLVNATRSYNSVTNNGAVTHSTSLNFCLDLFFIAGASRQMSEKDIIMMFERAYAQDKNITAKILFWARDARGGAGERRFFQVIMKHIGAKYPDVMDQLMIHVPEFGYWKDVFVVEKPDDNSLNWLSIQLTESPNANLLAKWFPRKGPWFVAMHRYLEMTPKEFRKKLVSMTQVVETQMCNKDWDGIKYEAVPSIAMNKYRKAFFKHSEARMTKYIEAVHAGETKINAAVLFPHLLYDAINEGQNERAVEAQWISLPDYMEGSTERILPVCDVSGSMMGLPMSVSVSLGIYISERNQSIFKDAFLTFHSRPEMQYLKGSLAQRMRQLRTAPWGGSTNLQATFELVLASAVREKISEDEMPTKILIISDMEFNAACGGYGGNTNLDGIRQKYQAAGYKMPELIFWNVNGRPGNVPAQVNDKGVGLVSGFSPSILKTILKGAVYGPVELMLDTVMADRYKGVQID
jgi:hypothetical protein